MGSLNRKLVMAILLALPLASMAQQQPNYLDEMAHIDAQINLTNKQVELRDALKKGAGSDITLPQVISIVVDSKGASAQLLYGSGLQRWVSKGDFVMDGFTVTSVSSSSVSVGGKGGKFHLDYVRPAAATGTAQSPAMINLPLTPPVINLPMPPLPSVVSSADGRVK